MRRAVPLFEIAPGLQAVPPGLLWIEQTQTLVAADAHLAYEDVIGGALPTWSTDDAAMILRDVAQSVNVREILFLGDIIHGSRMSEGAAGAVQTNLQCLRDVARLTLVAGNHEGASRGLAVLGETIEFAERGGWMLVHGDRARLCGDSQGTIIGHLHPSIRSNGTSAPAFLASSRLVVVPALTPYSEGLDVCSDACFEAMQRFGVKARRDVAVFAATHERVYPLGSLSSLRQELTRPSPPRYGYRRKFLRPD